MENKVIRFRFPQFIATKLKENKNKVFSVTSNQRNLIFLLNTLVAKSFDKNYLITLFFGLLRYFTSLSK
jgi:hypothetical protein